MLLYILVGVGCLVLGYFFVKWNFFCVFYFFFNFVVYYVVIDDMYFVEDFVDKFEDFKMVLVVRNDLKMGKGKVVV